jgi:hypothetical protein
MTNLKEKITESLKANNYQSDRELADDILGIGSAQQSINIACRQLEVAGIIGRTERPIKNFIGEIDPTQSKQYEMGLVKRKQTNGSVQVKAESRKKIEYLKKEFNSFWNEFFETELDYYSEFTLNKLAQLKMAVANINNLITYQSTIMAAQLIGDILGLPQDDVDKLMVSVEETNANSNGYDIEYNGSIPFLCEVKANIPAGGRDVFGEAQKKQLRKDIEALINGKSKSSIKESDLDCYYKFLCLYCNNNRTVNAARQFVSLSNKEYGNRLEFWSGQEALDKEKIYVFYVVSED